MKKIVAIIILSLGLSGCGKQYMMYAEAQKVIAAENAKAYAAAETARYNALAQIAKDGDPASRVAAAMSLSLGGGNGGNRAPQTPNLTAPKSASDTALAFTNVLLPVAATVYGISANRDVAIKQSDNQRAQFESTNSTMLGMSNAQSATATAGFNAINGVATAGFKSVSDTANSGFNSVSKMAENIKPNITINSGNGSSINAGNSGTSSSGAVVYEYSELQTIQTLAGNGVIGSGSYNDSRNNSVNSSFNPNNAVDNRIDRTNNSTTNSNNSNSYNPNNAVDDRVDNTVNNTNNSVNSTTTSSTTNNTADNSVDNSDNSSTTTTNNTTTNSTTNNTTGVP